MDYWIMGKIFSPREFLERLHRKKPMALVANLLLYFVRPALAEADLFHFFDFITNADDVKNRNPDSAKNVGFRGSTDRRRGRPRRGSQSDRG